MQTIAKFLADSKVFYLATNNGETPDVRPMGIAIPLNEKLYFITAKPMKLNEQLQKDGKVSISASDGEKYLRLYGTAILDDSKDTIKAFHGMNETIAKMFPEEIIAPYYLSDVTASIDTMAGKGEIHKF